MKLLSFAAAILFTFLAFAQTHAQGLVDGFMRGQRKASLAVTASHEEYDTYYVGTRAVQNPNLGTVTTEALNAYGVYGLGYDLDLIVNASYVRTGASAGYWPKQEGFQDLSGALRWEAYDYKIGRGRLSWLFAVGYSLPLQNYVTDALVTIGRGSRNFDGRTILHFKSGAFFLSGQYGYIRRGKVTLDRVVNYYQPDQLNPNSGSAVNVPDATEFIIRGGVSAKPFYVDGWFQRQTPFKDRGTDIRAGVPFPTNGVGFTRAGVTLYLPLIKKFGLTGSYSTTLDGRNIGKASRLSGGVILGL